MKKYFVSASLLLLLAACGGNNTDQKATDDKQAAPAVTAATDNSSNPDYQKGLALVVASNCTTCHKVNEKLIGPAYQDVAAKYAGVDTAVTHLAKKVIAGGQGVWGAIPMTAHPELSQADAEQMVKYILLLKK